MKRYADYTKDDLMLLLESLTPGGSEFHESPATCIEFVRARYAAGTSLVIKRGMAEKQRDSLLAACEAARQWLGPMRESTEWGDYYSTLIALQLKLDAAIAAAKGEA